MKTPHQSPQDPDAPRHYAIHIKGHLDDRWADWFDGLTMTREANGETLLSGSVADQAALHGLLRKVRDLGLPLLAVVQLAPPPANEPDTDPDSDRNRLTQETDR